MRLKEAQTGPAIESETDAPSASRIIGPKVCLLRPCGGVCRLKPLDCPGCAVASHGNGQAATATDHENSAIHNFLLHLE